MTSGLLSAGFADPVRDAQAGFRVLLDAMARPGTIAVLPTLAEPPPAPFAAAAAAIALTLCDADTPVWLDGALAAGRLPDWLRFHCGAPIASRHDAASFVFAAGAPPDMATLDQGSDLYPDRSATLVAQIAGFGAGQALRLSGPGIRDQAIVRAHGLAADFVAQRAANGARYPRGVDCILVAGQQALCLPRSTRVETA